MNAERCISCDAPIQWAQTLQARKWIALEPGPVEDGNLELIRALGTPPLVRLVPLVERDGRDDLRRIHEHRSPR